MATTTTTYVSSYSALSRLVQSQGLLRRRYGHYWTRILGTVTAFAAVWYLVVILGDSWFQLLAAAALALVCTQVGFLGHDAAHRQVFASHRWNEWSARILSGAFAGLSYGWWMTKHNRHHAAPNQQDRDPDIAPGALVFTESDAAARTPSRARLDRFQGWFFFPLLALEGLNLHVKSIRRLLDRTPVKHRWVEAALIAVRLGGNVVAVLLLLPPGKAAAFLAVQTGLFGVLLGSSFAPNHKGMPIVPADLRVDFLRRQVLMSRNVRGGLLLDFAMGGLNRQIEHHLFPSMPSPNLRRARALVQAHCARHGVPYTEVGLLESYRIVIRYLNAVGYAGRDPFHCPLVAEFRE